MALVRPGNALGQPIKPLGPPRRAGRPANISWLSVGWIAKAIRPRARRRPIMGCGAKCWPAGMAARPPARSSINSSGIFHLATPTSRPVSLLAMSTAGLRLALLAMTVYNLAAARHPATLGLGKTYAFVNPVIAVFWLAAGRRESADERRRWRPAAVHRFASVAVACDPRWQWAAARAGGARVVHE